ncbi:MAG TPA: DUF362 domain-containing protein [Methanoculleus sp.]|nr:DUF362 domain-containing protein [Methanoculleus sp.]
MASTVYVADLRARGPGDSIPHKLQRLFDAAGFDTLVAKGDRTAIKLHFGEKGNTTYLSPVFVRALVDRVRQCGARPFLTDTNTLYTGSRDNAVDHLTTAIEHGFAYAVAGAPVIIADGLTSAHSREAPVAGTHFSSVKIAGDICDADSMIVLSHFKGHELAGFGGAIKNLAMGCAPAAGKLEQHAGLQPAVDPALCTGCGECALACPRAAIEAVEGASRIRIERCIGCGECITVCPAGAIAFDWEHGVPVFLERMAEYACGIAAQKAGKVGYLNFLLHITPDCDCVPWSDAPIVPDIGILASTDPVALDRASLDLVNRQQGLAGSLLSAHHRPGEHKFRGTWPHTDGDIQIVHAERLGLGTTDYRLEYL